MSKYLDRAMLIANAPPMGEQIRINHDGCSAGLDTKERLYIKTPEDNVSLVMGYCHHCGVSGVAYLDFKARYRSSSDTAVAYLHKNEAVVPADAVKDLDKWPTSARVLLTKYGFAQADIQDMGIMYVPSADRILFPFCVDPRYIPIYGYQLKRIGNGRTPKYYNVKPSTHKQLPDTYSPGRVAGYVGESPNTVVIVEDILSAYQCTKVGYRGHPLYGSSPSKEHLFMLSKAWPGVRIAVWFDNDNSKVISNATEAYDFLRLVHSGKVGYVHQVVDPKECCIAENHIESYIEEAFK